MSRITVRWKKPTSIVSATKVYEVRRNQQTVAQLQSGTGGWFWYGQADGPKVNTARLGMRDFELVKAEAIAACKEHYA